MNHADLVGLTPLMARTTGRPEIVIGLIDGPVALDHPDFEKRNIRQLGQNAACGTNSSAACTHGTYVAGFLAAKRGSAAPAICPDCTLLVRPIFVENTEGSERMPNATAEQLADAILGCIEAQARVLNLSVALAQPTLKGERRLVEVLDYAAQRGVIPVAAAGNQGIIGSSAITRHPWVIPVTACDQQGKPVNYANLGKSIGGRGLRAPGEDVTSLGLDNRYLTMSGTSAAVPWVTGAIALLWSLLPFAAAAQLKFSLSQIHRNWRIIPPLLNAWAACQFLARGKP